TDGIPQLFGREIPIGVEVAGLGEDGGVRLVDGGADEQRDVGAHARREAGDDVDRLLRAAGDGREAGAVLARLRAGTERGLHLDETLPRRVAEAGRGARVEV